MQHAVSYKTYWAAWGLLLILTLVMIGVEGLGLGKAAAVVVLGAAALTKVTVIGGWFMHLKHERRGLVVTVVVAGLATAAVLFGLIAVDGLSMRALSE